MKKTNFFPALIIALFALPVNGIAQKQKTPKKVELIAAASSSRQFGLENSAGKQLTEAKYDALEDMGNGFWSAQEKGAYGIIDSTGKWIVAPAYRKIVQYKNGLVVAGQIMNAEFAHAKGIYIRGYNSYMDSVLLFGVADAAGTWVIQPEYTWLEIGDGGTYLFRGNDDLFGFLNEKGEVIIEPKFQYATTFHGNVAVVSEGGIMANPEETAYRYSRRYTIYSGGTWSVIGKDGKIVSTTTYDYVRMFSDGRAAFNKGGKWRRKSYSDNYILNGGKWGFIDENGTEVIPAKYTFVYDFENGKAKVRDDKDVTWIGTDGNVTTAATAMHKVSMYCKGSRAGFIDTKGNWKIMPQFYKAGRFSEGLAGVQPLLAGDEICRMNSGSEYGDYYHERNMNPFDNMEEELDYILNDMVTDTMQWVKRYWGYTDVNGKMIIPAKFDNALPFSNGRAYVCYRGKWGVIDKTGKWIFAPVMDLPDQMTYGLDGFMYGPIHDVKVPWYFRGDYEEFRTNLFSFREGIGVVYYKYKFGYIDSTGKIIAAPVYDDAEPFSRGRGAVRHGDFSGYVDRNGKEVIALKFKAAASFGPNGLARVAVPEEKSSEQADTYETESYDYPYRQNLYGFIDTTGVFVIKAEFLYASDFSEGLAMVTNRQMQKGFIDDRGKYVIQPQYRQASDMVNGYAMVVKSYQQAHFINAKGKDVPGFSATVLPPHTERLVPANDDSGKMGYWKNDKSWAIAPAFESAGNFYPVE